MQISSRLAAFTPSQLALVIWGWRSVELSVPPVWEQVFRAASERVYPATQLQVRPSLPHSTLSQTHSTRLHGQHRMAHQGITHQPGPPHTSHVRKQQGGYVEIRVMCHRVCICVCVHRRSTSSWVYSLSHHPVQQSSARLKPPNSQCEDIESFVQGHAVRHLRMHAWTLADCAVI